METLARHDTARHNLLGGLPHSVRQALLRADFVIETQERVMADALRALGASVAVERLTPIPAGDGATRVRNMVNGFEFKSADDLLMSWTGRRMRCQPDCDLCHGRGCQRLDSQLTRMLQHYDNVVLGVHGWFGLTPDGYVRTGDRLHRRRWDGLWNALDKWQRRGVTIQLAVDRRHLAQRMISLRSYWLRRER